MSCKPAENAGRDIIELLMRTVARTIGLDSIRVCFFIVFLVNIFIAEVVTEKLWFQSTPDEYR